MKKKFVLLFCISYITTLNDHLTNNTLKTPKNLEIKNNSEKEKNSNYEFSVKNLFQKMSLKLGKKEKKRLSKRKRKLKNHEKKLIKKLYNTIKKEKTFKIPKLKKSEKKRMLTLKEITAKRFDLVLKSIPKLKKKNRKLFADIISEFGVTQIQKLFSVFMIKIDKLFEDPMSVINNLVFVYFLFGIYKYFTNQKTFKIQSRFLKKKKSVLKNMRLMIDNGKEDLLNARMGVDRMMHKVVNLNRLFRFRIDTKIKMFYNFITN